MPVGPLGREHHHPDDAAGAAVPLDGLPQCALDKLDRLRLLHALPPVRVTVAVDVSRPGAADGVRLLVERAAQWDRVDLSAVPLIPARDDKSGSVGECMILSARFPFCLVAVLSFPKRWPLKQPTSRSLRKDYCRIAVCVAFRI